MTPERPLRGMPRLSRCILAAIVAAGISLNTAGAVELEHTATLTVRNETSFEMLMLFISAVDSDFFGPEMFGVHSTLPSGRGVEFTVHTDEACFQYDVLGIDVDGDMHYSIVDLCPDEQTVVRLGETGPLADPPALEHFIELRIVNEHTEAIDELYASAVDGRYLGANLLAVSGSLNRDETTSVLLAESEAVSYNVVATDSRGWKAAPTVHLHEHRGTGVERLEVRVTPDLFESD